MTEVWFYHLQSRPLDDTLPRLLERSLERGWHVVVQTTDPQRIEALDQSLWTFRDDSFLPHGREGDALQAYDPIILATSDINPNQAALRVLIDRAPLPEDALHYERIVLMFDGQDELSLVDARAQWAKAKKMGLDVTYWQQDDRGAWGKRNV
jgi:DNA polymerase III subunit chi